MSVWSPVVGQVVVPALQEAVSDAAAIVAGAAGSGAMTHAWLVTGPPGSGRSVVARALAAALQCEAQPPGCGACPGCRTALAGSHPDVTHVATDQLTLKIKLVRELVGRAALKPSRGRWQVVVVEDADRLGEDAADALLLSVEEPPARTVWVLCAPTPEDIVATVRSRCRVVMLRTPPADAVARHLTDTSSVDPAMAAFAARASQGHIGRARALATQEQARLRRDEVLRLPFELRRPADCLAAAAVLVEAAGDDAKAHCDDLDERELAAAQAIHSAEGGRRTRALAAAVRALEEDQRLRRKRVQRDSLDRALVDLLALYRDVLALQLGAGGPLVNDEMRDRLERLADAGPPEATLRRMEAVVATREALETNVAPLLALEAMALTLGSAG